MNILIVVPSFEILGGVANHYMGLHPYWTNHVIYSFQGRRKKIPAIIMLIPDYTKYLYLLIFKNVDVVFVNPSLCRYQLIRDAIYIWLARLFKKKVVTFIHGWDWKTATYLTKHSLMFLNTFGKSKFIYCLGSDFRNRLIEQGIKCPILLTTTKVSDELIADFNISKRNGEIREILFLARLEKSKGIYQTLEAYKKLKSVYPYLSLSICGSGSEEQSAKKYVNDNNIADVRFYGNVSGSEKITRFSKADIYILPTTHHEGMTTSILEGMAFGLPIISRPIGGIVDFFIQGKMGFLLDSTDAYDYAERIEFLLKRPGLVKQIAINNYQYAIQHFLASSVVRAIEHDLHLYINS